MKKIIILVLLIVAFSFSAWSDYQPITWERLAELVQHAQAEAKETPGATLWKEPYKIELVFESYPEKTTDEEILNSIEMYRKILYGKDQANYFSKAYILRCQKNSKNYILVFQDTLVPYLREEVKLGESIELYIVMGYYNAFSDETILFVNEFTSTKSVQADKLSEQGETLMNEKKYAEAINIFDQVLTIYPKDVNSCYNKGLCLIKLKKYHEALPYFDKVLQHDDKDAGAYFQKGICYENIKQFDQAVENFNKTIALEPQEASTYFERAGCYFDLKKYEQAIVDYKKSLALNEKYAGVANFSLGCTEAILDHPESACDYLALAIKAGYKDKDEYYNSPHLVKLKDSPKFKELLSSL